MTYYRYSTGYSFGFLTPAVRALLVGTAAAFLVQMLADAATGGRFTAVWFSLSWRGLSAGRFWQPVTYLFLHGGLWHLLFNLLGLFFFGPETERALGSRRFIGLYLACGILAGLGWVLISGRSDAWCLGASGAVYGVLGAFAGMFPERRITLLLLFVIPVTLSARALAIGLGAFSLLAMLSQPGQIAYAAHLAGGLAGYLYGRHAASRAFGRAGFSLRRWWEEWRWQRQRRKIRIWHGPRGEGPAEEEPPSEQEINAVLDKLSRWGLGSLDVREREILDRASRRR